MSRRTGVVATIGVLVTAASATAAPLWVYSLSLALFGLPHVLAELRYVDARFGARVGRALARWLWAGLAAIVALRLVALGGGGAPMLRTSLELALGAALVAGVVAAVVPRLRARGALAQAPWTVAAGLAATVVAITLALWSARACPLEAIVWFAVLHNLTPVGFLAERLRGRARQRALLLCSVVFGLLPALIASGAAAGALAAALEATFGVPSGALGAQLSSHGPPGVGALERHLGVFVPGAWVDSPGALDLFRAAAFLQCMHYAVVLHVLPRLGAGAAIERAPLCWPRWRSTQELAFASCAGLTLGFALAFTDARTVYAVFAAVHAWIELPILALACLGSTAEERVAAVT
ncbi:MAG: hypothetical protein R3F49_03445 [Planctomycetota bacterium]